MSNFDRFMIHVDLGTEEKLADLTDSERLCHIVGVLAIAAKSPIRGLLIVGESEATPAQIAKRADVTRKVAENTLRKLKAVGILTRDEEAGAWRVHAWEKFNPAPKVDRTNAERQARYRARNGTSNAVSNGTSGPRNADEVEVEGEEKNNPPCPPQAGGVMPDELEVARERLRTLPPTKPTTDRKRDVDAYEAQLGSWVAAHFPGCRPSAVEGLIGWVTSRGVDPTPDALREFADAAPTFAHVLEPAA